MDSLGTAQLLPGLVVLDWLLLQGAGLQTRRVNVLQERRDQHQCGKINAGASALPAGGDAGSLDSRSLPQLSEDEVISHQFFID